MDAADAEPPPTLLTATTVHVTAMPLVRPVTTIRGAEPEATLVPQVALYPRIAEPPLLVGAVNVTETVALPAVAVPIVGGPGTVAVGVTPFDAAEAAPLPTAFVASTVQVTGMAVVRPVTVIGEDGPAALCVPHVAR